MRWKRSGSDLVYVSDVVGIRHVQNQNREPVLNPPPREVGIERPLTWEPGHRLLSHVTVTTRPRLHQETPMPILKCILASDQQINCRSLENSYNSLRSCLRQFDCALFDEIEIVGRHFDLFTMKITRAVYFSVCIHFYCVSISYLCILFGYTTIDTFISRTQRE